MTATFTNYVGTKQDTRSDYRDIVETWKVDRPFTNQLRSKNYQIIGKQNLKDITAYRHTAE